MYSAAAATKGGGDGGGDEAARGGPIAGGTARLLDATSPLPAECGLGDMMRDWRGPPISCKEHVPNAAEAAVDVSACSRVLGKVGIGATDGALWLQARLRVIRRNGSLRPFHLAPSPCGVPSRAALLLTRRKGLLRALHLEPPPPRPRCCSLLLRCQAPSLCRVSTAC